MKFIPTLLLSFLLILGTANLQAVPQNHYIPGTNGLRSAYKPEKALIYTNQYFDYRAQTVKGLNFGRFERLIDPITVKSKEHIRTDLNIFSWFTGWRIFGAVYGCQAIIPYVNITAETVFFRQVLRGGTRGSFRLSDCYFEPLNLTWHFSQLDLLASFGFYAPTGKYKPLGRNNTGFGNWTQQYSLAATYYFDYEKTWSASAYAAYEVHGKKKKTNLTPGDCLTIDWGVGKTIKEAFNIGIVGYAEWQLFRNRGTLFKKKDIEEFAERLNPEITEVIVTIGDRLHLNRLLTRSLNRVFAIGPEANMTLPFIGGSFISLIFRYEHEFKAKARPKGHVFIGAAALIF